MTITEFLLARIAEDEASLQNASDYECWHGVDREMAECEAKRRIVGHHAPLGDEFVLCAICTEVGPDAQLWPCLTLRALAAVYADHPDYREEWRP